MVKILSISTVLAAGLISGVFAERIYLSGTGPSDAVEWDFKCSNGRKSGEWAKIPVPSNWEQHGFGDYDYGHVRPADKHDETGTYRVKFHAPKEWKNKVVRLVFEGSMTDTSVKLNGKPIGTMNQGGYNQFHILLTDTGRYGQHAFEIGKENELEILVAKTSANASLEHAERKADYWVFGGIYRPVYLEVLPKAFINRVAIDADAGGQFRMDVFPQVHLPRDKSGGDHVDEIIAQIESLDGEPVGKPMSAELMGGGVARVRLAAQLKKPKRWSPEFPNLYQVRISMKLSGKTLHEKVERFGFRTLELRPGDGFYLNGKKLRYRGVNRNGFRPDTARALDSEDAWEDARAIKAMNANAVRCHLPPSKAFMEACDELGLLFVVERTNWQRPVADASVSRELVYNLVTQLHNHPSLAIWANGNESGFNHEVDDLFAVMDLQERPVIHPWAPFGGVDTKHYVGYDDLKTRLESNGNVLLTTEFLHGLFDGGHGAGLDDYWELMRKHPLSAGGFLWCWADAAVERTDQNGKLDTDGNHSADGIVGPYGEKEGSYYAIREIWSPIQIPLDELPHDFNGTLPVENRFDGTSLDQCGFHWRLVKVSDPLSENAETKVFAKGALKAPSVKPGQTGELRIPLSNGWKDCTALELIAVAPDGRVIMHWSWAINRSPAGVGNHSDKPKQVAGKPFDVQLGNVLWSFSPDSGLLVSCSKDGKDLGFGKGPLLYAGDGEKSLTFSSDWKSKVIKKGDTVVIESSDGKGNEFSWTLSPGGKAALDYSFAKIEKELTYCAVGFDLDEDQVASKRWLGDGAFRVWANRRKGGRYGLWENETNDGITGVNFIYPEFKGVFGNVDWMRIDMKCGARIVLETQSGSAVGVLRPKNAVGDKKSGPRTATWDYPTSGGLFLFHKVPAVGTKFKKASALGAQSGPERIDGPVMGTVVIHIR